MRRTYDRAETNVAAMNIKINGEDNMTLLTPKIDAEIFSEELLRSPWDQHARTRDAAPIVPISVLSREWC